MFITTLEDNACSIIKISIALRVIEREREREGKEREEPMKRGQEILPAACPLERMERACQ